MKREVNMRSQISEQKRQGSTNKQSTNQNEPKKQESRIITDPFGSWTGVPEDDFFGKPIQDVDDL